MFNGKNTLLAVAFFAVLAAFGLSTLLGREPDGPAAAEVDSTAPAVSTGDLAATLDYIADVSDIATRTQESLERAAAGGDAAWSAEALVWRTLVAEVEAMHGMSYPGNIPAPARPIHTEVKEAYAFLDAAAISVANGDYDMAAQMLDGFKRHIDKATSMLSEF